MSTHVVLCIRSRSIVPSGSPSLILPHVILGEEYRLVLLLNANAAVLDLFPGACLH